MQLCTEQKKTTLEQLSENCKLLIESDIDFLVRIISIMKEEYVKKNNN